MARAHIGSQVMAYVNVGWHISPAFYFLDGTADVLEARKGQSQDPDPDPDSPLFVVSVQLFPPLL